jgi:hypothetical protein
VGARRRVYQRRLEDPVRRTGAWLAAIVMLSLVGCDSAADPGESGVVAGTVGFIGLPCLPPGDGPPCDGPYPGYVVRALTADLHRVVAQDTTDADGRYAINLAPGDYAFETPHGLPPANVQVTRFTVVAGESVTVDLVVDVGIR